jgi:hypothetical protein
LSILSDIDNKLAFRYAKDYFKSMLKKDLEYIDTQKQKIVKDMEKT